MQCLRSLPSPMLHLERLEDRLLLSAGDLDVGFAGGKATANFSLGAAQVQALAVQADGKIIAAGQAGGALGGVTTITYNTMNKVTNVTDPLGLQTASFYDQRGWMTTSDSA